MTKKEGKKMGKPKLEKTKEKHVFSYITKNKQKKYAYRYRYTRKDNTRHEEYQQGFNTLKEAALALAEMKVELLKGNYSKVDNKDLTVKELFEMFYEHQSNSVAGNTLVSTRNAMRKMDKYIGHLKLTQLNAYTYRKYFISAVENELAQSTLKEYNGKLNAALNFAVKNDFVDRNRIKGQNFKVTTEKKVYTEEEIAIIFDCTKEHPHMYMPVLFLMHTGVRAGEMVALKWKDIDFKKNVVRIERTYTCHGYSKPKSRHSVRDIPMSKKLATELKKHKAKQKAMLLERGAAAKINVFDENYVFLSKTGTATLHYERVKVFFRYVKEKGVKDAKAHVFRHTFASRLISEGVDVATVAALLGDTVETVQRVYVHAIEDKKEEAIQKIEKIMFYQ